MSIVKELSEAYEIVASQEVPRLTTKDAVIAFEYFKNGYIAAKRKYEDKQSHGTHSTGSNSTSS